jgi:hypothetical protein
MEAIIIVAAFLVAPGLAFAGVLSWLVAFLVDIGVLFIAAWWFDRGRAIGARFPVPDPNRADFSGPMAVQVRPVSTEAIERPSDRPGTP